jgi:hypothetical protein
VIGVSADYKVSTVGEGATPYLHYAISQKPDTGRRSSRARAATPARR